MELFMLQNKIFMFFLIGFFVYSCVSFETTCGKVCEPEKKNLEVDQIFLDKFKNYKIKPRKHQAIPAHYLYSNPNQKGLLINHFVGTGKTYLAMFFSELYQKKNVIIMGPKYLEANWIDSLKNFPVKKMSRYEYIAYKDAPTKLGNKDISDTILVMDEAHNIIKYLTSYDLNVQSLYSDVYLKLFSAYKILALTATPIQEEESDIAYLLNLVSGKIIIPTNKEEFRLQYSKIIKNRAFWRGHITESMTLINLSNVIGIGKQFELFAAPPVFGAIGAVFPIINYFLYPTKKYSLRRFHTEKLRGHVIGNVSFSGYTSTEGSKDYPDRRIKIKDVVYSKEQHQLFFRLASNNLTVEDLKNIFPAISYSDKKFKLVNSTLVDRYRKDINAGLEIGNLFLKDENKTTLIPPKFLEIKKILGENPGKTVFYSLFAQKGIELLESYLDQIGFKGRYKTLTPHQTVAEQRQVIEEYNEDKIKIVLLHPEIIEGISLLGTRQLHILEPIGNNSHYEQVMGRVIRYRSHHKLPEEERFVDIYVWKSMLDDSGSFSFKSLMGSKYRHEDWNKRYPEFNYYSNFGTGKSQVDSNSEYKYWSPDEGAYYRLNLLKDSIDSFNEMLSEYSIERHYRKLVKKEFPNLREKKKREYLRNL